jgi:ABC-2 type transport system permease protein
MVVYLYILYFEFLRFLAYPVEIIANIVKRVVEIGILIFLWSLVLKNTSNGLDLRHIASYFLVAVGVGEIVMAKWGPFGSLLANSIRQGFLSNYLIRPRPILPTLYFTSYGGNGLRALVALFTFLLGIYLNPPQTVLAVILFFVFLVAAFAVAFAYNLFLGSLYFHIGEASGIKNSIEHMSRILSGAFVPLAYFPKSSLALVKLLPFQVMVYGPTNAISINSISSDVLNSVVIAFFWAIFLNIAAFLFWRRSIKSYEASGI